MREIGPMLRARRKALGLNQEAMAARLYVDASTISYWEKGTRRVQPECYAAICAAYELDYCWFIVAVFELSVEDLAASDRVSEAAGSDENDGADGKTYLTVVPRDRVA